MKKWLIIILIFLIVVYLGYNYLYQDHRDIQTEKAAFVLSTSDIIDNFNINSIAAEKKYLNKTIEISGKVTEVNKLDLTLDNAVFFTLKDTLIRTSIGDHLKLKGRFIGYDDLLEIIKIDQASILN